MSKLFTANQVNQVYVVTEFVDTPLSEAQAKSAPNGTLAAIIISDNPDGSVGLYPGRNGIVFKYKNAMGEWIRTDIIENIMWTKTTPAEDMRTYLKTCTVKLSEGAVDTGGNPIIGQDYILRIAFTGYIGISPEDSQYWKYGAVHATAGMTATKFYEAMAKSINTNMAREAVKLVEVTGDANGIHIKQTEPDWILGTKQQKFVDFTVAAGPITVVEGTTVSEIAWAEPEDITYGFDTENPIGNGKLMADYEYFYHGEMGDQYRNVGWPDVIPTKYMIDPSKEYATLGIHYAFIGSNESVQKSEKDITFIVESSNISILGGIKSRVTYTPILENIEPAY